MKKINLLLVFMASFICGAKAQIVYMDVNPDITGDNWSLPILGTTFESLDESPAFATDPYDLTNARCMVTTLDNAAILNTGNMIAPTNNWNGDAWNIGTITDKYLGIRIGTAGNYRYGWILFSHAAADIWTIKSYAYQNTPNTAIAAGDMGTPGTVTAPVTAFTGNPLTVTTSVTNVTFTDQTSNNPTTWAWSFTPNTVIYQNGTTAASQNPQVKFTAAGSYAVKLITSNTAGSNTLNRPNYVTVQNPAPQPPDANFSANNTAPVVNATVITFSDQSLNAPTSWTWSFTPNTVIYQNGTTANSPNPKVIFGATGSYTVKLVVSSQYGSDSITKPNYITVVAPQGPPVANFSANVTTATANTTVVSFTDLSTANPNSWSWFITPNSFVYQNNTNSASANPRVLFNAAGYYTVKLKVRNAEGADSITKTAYIHVESNATAVNTVQKTESLNQIFPNPTSDYLRFEIAKDSKIQRVTIMNVAGKVVKTFAKINKNEVSVADLPAGIYWVQAAFVDGSKSTFRKFSKL